MNSAQVLQNFWASFQWKAYDENTVPERSLEQNDSKIITYEFGIPSDYENTIGLTASLWHKSTSWKTITDKANEIRTYLGYGGQFLKVDGGYLWIKRGQPFAQRMSDEDDTLRRILLNIEVDFLSE